MVLVQELSLPVRIAKEEDSKGKPIFVALCPLIDVVSQGRTKKKAIENLKEAIELYFEDDDSNAKNMCTFPRHALSDMPTA